MIVHHDGQTRVISLQRDFDHVPIVETGMPKRVSNQLGDNELGICQNVLGKITDRSHLQARFPDRPYVITERKAHIAQLTVLFRLPEDPVAICPPPALAKPARLHR